MKKNLIILTLTSCLLTACTAADPHPKATVPATTVPIVEVASATEATVPLTDPAAPTVPESVPAESIQETTVPEETETTAPAETVETVPKETEEASDPVPTKPRENIAPNSEPAKTQPRETTPPETIPPETEPIITVPPETVPFETEAVVTEPEETNPPETQAPAETSAPAAPEFSRSNVEAAILKYINQYRSSPLTKLSGMSKVARERSKQILSNFDHVTKDIREAHAKYQYGEFVDMTVHGLPESENYYSSHTGEAIAYRGQGADVTTADEMGRQIAEQLRESSSHWSYVGSSKYSFCGIGCTKVSGDWGDVWFVCIMVGTVNYG